MTGQVKISSLVVSVPYRKTKPKRRTMLLTERHEEILTIVRNERKATVKKLASHFSVTEQTIRKNLNELCEKRLIQRTHGGAIPYSGTTNMEHEVRRLISADEKSKIAQRIASLIPEKSSILLTIGTTTEAVATALEGHNDLLIITNNINVANILRVHPKFEVIIASGVVRSSDGGIVGESASNSLNQFKVDYAIISVSAIDEDGSLLDFDFREVQVLQKIILNAHHVILAADSTKLTRTAPVRIGHISQIDTFVTDRIISHKFKKNIEDANVETIEICPEKNVPESETEA